MIPLPHMQDHAQMDASTQDHARMDASTLTPLSSLNYPITNPLPFMMPLVCSVLASFFLVVVGVGESASFQVQVSDCYEQHSDSPINEWAVFWGTVSF